MLLSSRDTEPFSRTSFDTKAFDGKWRGVVKSEIAIQVTFAAPALPLQESLLTETMQRADAYWSNNLYTLEPHIDLTRLLNAWEHVVSLIDALRTAFVPTARLSDDADTDSTFLQLICEEAHVNWTVVESTEALFESDVRARVDRVAKRYQTNRFVTLPWAITVYVLESRRVMMLTIHHSIRDDVSLGYILSDLEGSYRDSSIVQHRQQLKDALDILLPNYDQLKQDEQYWARNLADFSAAEEEKSWPQLTTGFERSASQSVVYKTKIGTSYRELKASAIGLGASSVVPLLRVALGCILCQYL